jgi:Zn-dependent protease
LIFPQTCNFSENWYNEKNVIGGIRILTLHEIWHGLDWSYLTDILLNIIPALICITFHEVSHGYVAYKLGDPTAKEQGRLSLNPIRHIDLMGLAMMAIFRFGWAKPVPVNMHRLPHPKRDMAIVALAGPCSNLLLAVLSMFFYGLFYPFLNQSNVGVYILNLLFLTSYISVALAVFNILPISPLDGSKILFTFLDDASYYRLMRYERYGMLLLVVLVATGILGRPLSIATGWVMDRIWTVGNWGYALAQLIR